jgi:inosine/xanthosine triphosphatase
MPPETEHKPLENHMTMRVAVGTESALKLRAVETVCKSLMRYPFEIIARKAASGVSIQPVGVEEMERGASNRAQAAWDAVENPGAAIGIESGLIQRNGRWFDQACVVVLGSNGGRSVAFGAEFPIPRDIAEQTLAEKSELGEVIKKRGYNGEKDPMHYLSGGKLKREDFLVQAIQCALIRPTQFHLYDTDK